MGRFFRIAVEAVKKVSHTKKLVRPMASVGLWTSQPSKTVCMDFLLDSVPPTYISLPRLLRELAEDALLLPFPVVR